jgi:predicted outer membrane repeat protein
MRIYSLTTIVVLAVTSFVSAETHTIVVDATSITPATLEVAPGDTIFFDSVCATNVSTGQSCQADGILSGASYPPFCPDFEWTIPQLASVDLPIYARAFSGDCNDNRTAVITVVNGATLSVPGDFATIGDAIAAAQSGDRIDIAAGTYFEHDLYIDKTINLVGETNPDGSPAVKIDAQQQGRVFELVGGGPPPGEPGLIIMDNLIITGGDVDGDGGGLSILNCSPIFRNCRFLENTCTGNGGGINVKRAAQGSPWVNAQPTFASCMIMDNDALDGGGVHCFGDEFGSGCQPTFKNCLIIDNMASDGYGGLRHAGIGQATVEGSIICGNYPGQYAGNVDLDNGSCTLSQCLDTDGDGIVDDCEGGDDDGILNVPSEYPTLEMAWFEVADGDTIQLAAGTYYQNGVDELRLEDISVSIIGAINADGSPATILNGADSNVQYVTVVGDGNDTVTIQNLHLMYFTGVGGGLALGNCEAYIRNCIIEGSHGQTSGLLLSDVQGTVEDCWIVDNSHYFIASGVVINDSGAPSNITLKNTLVEFNSGVMLLSGQPGSTLNVVDCDIRQNSFGIEVSSPWTVTLADSNVCANYSGQIIGDWTDLGGNTVADECAADCAGDLDGNGVVSVDDLLALLAAYQTNGGGDCDGDGDTDVDDLLILIGAWGPCNA